MAAKSLTFDIFGRDKSASKSMSKVGKSADTLSRKFKAAGKGMARGMGFGALGVAAAGAAVVTFGKDSVIAFAAAQKSEADLQFALKKFPKTAKINIKVLQDYNKELSNKTRFDDDMIASGQAVLAGFDLTEKQLKDLTPLMLDYAGRTGKELPDAAKILGKALMGNGRGLKDLGISFKDQKDPVKNYNQLMGALRDTVGGFAEKDATTAAGKLDTLKNRFGEVQESIGEALMPALEDLVSFAQTDFMPWLEKAAAWLKDEGFPKLKEFRDWIVKWKDVLGPAAVAVGVLTAAQWLLNAAMAANPVGVVIMGLAAIIALTAIVVTGWEDMSLKMQIATAALIGPIGSVVKNWRELSSIVIASVGLWQIKLKMFVGAIAKSAVDVVNKVLTAVRSVLGPLNDLLELANMPTINIPVSYAIEEPSYSKSSGGGTGMAVAYGNTGEGRYSGMVAPSMSAGSSRGGVTNIYNLSGLVGSPSKLAQELKRAERNGRTAGAI